MSALKPELAKLVEDLLRGTKKGDSVSLDAIGDAVGARAISQDEIDAILVTIEKRGRRVASPAGGKGEAHLKLVIDAARTLRGELGRPARPEEIALKSGISLAEVQHALALVQIMQR
ncbi:MAG TPA: sigma-70 domain-containing protein [Labilithrix sp.]|nr:sigma-70 domain-containing protein [Labilithrix sp.]